ncbi:MAG: helix-turn-helix domain-containing protein [Kiloniellaceae bacterium]
MSKNRRLTRGTLSELTGCNIETIRYYERIGLLPEPPRSEGGHRLYDEELLRRLIFIRRSRELGFSLQEIRGLLKLVDGRNYTCAEVKEMTEVHLGNVQSKIADLKVLERTLKEMVSKCDGGQVPECPVIDALFLRGNGRAPR